MHVENIVKMYNDGVTISSIRSTLPFLISLYLIKILCLLSSITTQIAEVKKKVYTDQRVLALLVYTIIILYCVIETSAIVYYAYYKIYAIVSDRIARKSPATFSRLCAETNTSY